MSKVYLNLEQARQALQKAEEHMRAARANWHDEFGQHNRGIYDGIEDMVQSLMYANDDFPAMLSQIQDMRIALKEEAEK